MSSWRKVLGGSVSPRDPTEKIRRNALGFIVERITFAPPGTLIEKTVTRYNMLGRLSESVASMRDGTVTRTVFGAGGYPRETVSTDSAGTAVERTQYEYVGGEVTVSVFDRAGQLVSRTTQPAHTVLY